MPADIPAIPDDLADPVRALARAASLFRGVLVRAAGRRRLGDVLREYGETLELAERVLDRWAAHLDPAAGAGAIAPTHTTAGRRDGKAPRRRR